jgi:DHA1 family bicyclomycin/chloramphenicol resistance-like MFS transporter
MSKKLNKFLPLFLSVCFLVPFGNDLFIPSIPNLEQYFATTKVQLIMSVFMFGLSISQIFYGPCLDRFGRKPVVMLGLFIFIMGSILTIWPVNFQILLLARFIQAVGICCAMPAAMAILRDTLAPQKLLTGMSYLLGAVVIAPAIAPVFGSYLELYFGWRGSFVTLLLLGIFYLLVYAVFFKETLAHKNLDALNIKYTLGVFAKLLSHRNYVGFLLVTAFTYAGIFCYVSEAPILLIKVLHIPVKDFGWYFLLFALMISIMAFVVPKLGKKIELHYLTLIGIALFLLAAVIMLLLNIYFKPNVWLIMAPIILAGLSVGIVRPSATTSALKLVPPNMAGTSSSLFNVFLFFFGASSTALMAFLSHAIIVFVTVFVIIAMLGMLSSLLIIKISDPLKL